MGLHDNTLTTSCKVRCVVCVRLRVLRREFGMVRILSQRCDIFVYVCVCVCFMMMMMCCCLNEIFHGMV